MAATLHLAAADACTSLRADRRARPRGSSTASRRRSAASGSRCSASPALAAHRPRSSCCGCSLTRASR
eukprot:1332379-Prymnesium_polylepis.2